MNERQGLSLETVTQFEFARNVLAMLIGHSSSRAAIDPDWAVRRNRWMEQLNTLTSSDIDAVAYVLDVDLSFLRSLLP
ncbi:hypothetical protein [Nocardia asiatica]|uniref:hypothetical protein n=1 Tax=Nocardia asiatica TaxID=209252 RepID=UPI00031557F2|nr:hypothetical protein [Nocardia asiatica]